MAAALCPISSSLLAVEDTMKYASPEYWAEVDKMKAFMTRNREQEQQDYQENTRET